MIFREIYGNWFSQINFDVTMPVPIFYKWKIEDEYGGISWKVEQHPASSAYRVCGVKYMEHAHNNFLCGRGGLAKNIF